MPAQGPALLPLAARRVADAQGALDLRHERNMGFPAATLGDTTGKAMSVYAQVTQGRKPRKGHEP